MSIYQHALTQHTRLAPEYSTSHSRKRWTFAIRADRPQGMWDDKAQVQAIAGWLHMSCCGTKMRPVSMRRSQRLAGLSNRLGNGPREMGGCKSPSPVSDQDPQMQRTGHNNQFSPAVRASLTRSRQFLAPQRHDLSKDSLLKSTVISSASYMSRTAIMMNLYWPETFITFTRADGRQL